LSFTKRTQPLVDVDTKQREADAEFDTKWEAGEITGWEESNTKAQAVTNGTNAGIWCSACKYFLSRNNNYADLHFDLRPKELLQANCLRCSFNI
jgi:splicing factor 3A subunit 3